MRTPEEALDQWVELSAEIGSLPISLQIKRMPELTMFFERLQKEAYEYGFSVGYAQGEDTGKKDWIGNLKN